MKKNIKITRCFQAFTTALVSLLSMTVVPMAADTQKWDKTFPKSDKVIHEKVSYPNRYGITVAAEPKELYIVPGARHIDLYDRTDMIPFGKLTAFFNNNLE